MLSQATTLVKPSNLITTTLLPPNKNLHMGIQYWVNWLAYQRIREPSNS